MSEANVNKKRKNRWAFPLGLVITVFAVIGLVCVILAGVNATKKAVIKSKNIDEYNTMLTPVVMNDPDPFDDITKANKKSAYRHFRLVYFKEQPLAGQIRVRRRRYDNSRGGRNRRISQAFRYGHRTRARHGKRLRLHVHL